MPHPHRFQGSDSDRSEDKGKGKGEKGSDSDRSDDKGKGKGEKGKVKDSDVEQQHVKGKGKVDQDGNMKGVGKGKEPGPSRRKGKNSSDGGSRAFQPATGATARETAAGGGQSGAFQPALEATGPDSAEPGEETIATKSWQEGAVRRSLVGRPSAKKAHITWTFQENHEALRASQYDAQFIMEDTEAMYIFFLDLGVAEDEALRGVSMIMHQGLPRFILANTMQLYWHHMDLCQPSFRTALSKTPLTRQEEVMRMELDRMRDTLTDSWDLLFTEWCSPASALAGEE